MSRNLLIAAGVMLLATAAAVVGMTLASGPPHPESNTSTAAGFEPPDGFVLLPGGVFTMGTEERPGPDNPLKIKRDEFPAHEVELDSFLVGRHEVTNRQYAEFVDATGYVTVAERRLDADDLAAPGLDLSHLTDDDLAPSSLCFNDRIVGQAIKMNGPVNGQPWEYQAWELVKGADWRHPDGPDSSIDEKLDHPVVHVAFEDVRAYCRWAGVRLPTEAEFEYAAGGGHGKLTYPWGDVREPDGEYYCNYWQGVFPVDRQNLDGYEGTAPVGSFPPNAFGLFDVAGNVWEWCSDYYHEDYYSQSKRRNPQGPLDSWDSREPGIVKRSIRGGSFLCNQNNCTGYRVSARMASEEMSGAMHTGFRVALSLDELAAYRERQAAIAAKRAND